jgi:hypothetical protein
LIKPSTMITALLKVTGMVIILGCFQQLSAQDEAGEDAILQQISAALLQTGESNQAYIQQISSSNSLLTEISQDGYANMINLDQQGSNFAIYLRQEGNENEYVGEVDGLNATIDIYQHGNFNLINQAFGISDSKLTIIQEGDGHTLIQTKDVRNAVDMRITQKGEAGTIIIR